MTEVPLPGGNTTAGVVRAGDTVRRPRQAFAARVLGMLEAAGYPYAPRHLGVDGQGRDVLSFIPGETTDHPSQRAPGAYAAGGRMLRALHDLTSGHEFAAGSEAVLHGDPGPFNTIFRDGLPVALIDWDTARPGDRIDDAGYMAWTWCVQSQGNVPIADQAQHLREWREGYGDLDADTLIDAMLRRQTQVIATAGTATTLAWATADRRLITKNRSMLRG